MCVIMTEFIKKDDMIYKVVETTVDKADIEFHISQLQIEISKLESILETINLLEMEVLK